MRSVDEERQTSRGKNSVAIKHPIAIYKRIIQTNRSEEEEEGESKQAKNQRKNEAKKQKKKVQKNMSKMAIRRVVSVCESSYGGQWNGSNLSSKHLLDIFRVGQQTGNNMRLWRRRLQYSHFIGLIDVAYHRGVDRWEEGRHMLVGWGQWKGHGNHLERQTGYAHRSRGISPILSHSHSFPPPRCHWWRDNRLSQESQMPTQEKPNSYWNDWKYQLPIT